MRNDPDGTPLKRPRRSEPITRRTAKNGAVAYTFQLDIGVRPDGSRERQRFTFPRSLRLALSTGASPRMSRLAHS